MAGANPCSSPAFPAERLWQAFSAVGTFPRREVAEARESWSTISAIFLERFQSYVRDPQGHKKDADSLLIALHLFAEMRDTRIYRPLLAWACASPAALDSALGDAITETLNQVICSVFDGDPVPLQEAILDRRVDEYVAHALFEALAFLTSDSRIALGQARLFIERRYRQLPRDEDCGMRWVGWQKVVSYLGLTEYLPQVHTAFEEGWIKPGYLESEDFESDLAESLAARGRGELPPDGRMGYFGDTVEALSRWYCFTAQFPRDQERREREAANERKHERWAALAAVWRETGRNDPCPCGSGRKYKRCCLDKPELPAMASP